MTDTMKAVVLEAPGGPDNLVYKDVPLPELLDPHHVLVKVKACGVAYRDIIERRGGHPLLQTPIIQGHEFSGEPEQFEWRRQHTVAFDFWQPPDADTRRGTVLESAVKHFAGGRSPGQLLEARAVRQGFPQFRRDVRRRDDDDVVQLVQCGPR